MVNSILAEIAETVPGVPITIEGEFAEVSGDEALLRQAMLNLVRNAAEAVAEYSDHGCVIIRGEVEPTGSMNGQRILISDNGPGLPPESLSKIFMPFYTTKANGTGLGLAVVQKIVVQHGGAIEARNQPQGGAEFILWLPFVREPITAVEPAPVAHLK
jgi:signal transduction histidine kinase